MRETAAIPGWVAGLKSPLAPHTPSGVSEGQQNEILFFKRIGGIIYFYLWDR
jgi:hypothetical protein